jgi:predicted butyrate kinase (DUF1464 family)
MLGGIDVGSEFHHIFIIDDEDNTVFDSKVKHIGEELHKAVEEFKGLQRKFSVSLSFAMEGRNGYGSPLDKMLISNGFDLYPIFFLKPINNPLSINGLH